MKAIQAAANQPARALVERHRGVSSTEYRIVGEWDQVYDELTSIFDDYHPAGYGTRVHSIEMDSSGKYAARVSHSNSAD